MPKKKKPVKNWSPARFAKLDEPNKIEAALKAAEDALDLRLSDVLTNKFRNIIRFYLSGVYSSPSNNDIKEALQNLYDTSKNFLNAVSGNRSQG